MNILETPAERFENLPDFPFSPKYMEVEHGLKMHYVEEGPQEGEVVLLLHGEPSWSFLYRKMIPVFAEAGYRVLAPDLIGFGKSSKPTEMSDYSYQKHVEWVHSFISQLDLKGINLFCQDWGGLIGLRLVAETDRFARVVAGNTGMPTGDQQMPEAFLKWQEFSQKVPELPVGNILQNSTVRTLSPEEIAAYEAPFPDASYQAGAKIFPSLVPTRPDDPASEANRAAWKKLMAWDKPFLTLFSDSDPITKGGEKVMKKLIPGTQGQDHHIIEAGGHFLQEDKGEEIAERMIAFMKST